MKRNNYPTFFAHLLPCLLGTFLLLQLMSASAQNNTPVTMVEAESGTLTGVSIGKSDTGFSGTGYVTGFDAATDKLVVSLSVPAKAFYRIVIRYKCGSQKYQKIEINTSGASPLEFPTSASFADLDAGKYLFNKGKNTITISNSWGWVDFDKFTLYLTERNTYNVTKDLIDPLATAKTKELYNYLYSSFGKKIISGHTNGENHDKTQTLVGKSPMLKSWDFTTYTEGYPYSWNNATASHAFGAKPDGSTEQAIDWYNSTNKKGIVNFHWHWCSPSGGTVGKNTFSKDYTTFDIREAVKTGTPENILALRDIDVIAAELKKLSDKDIPVLWRPLHEAGGAWFWWGAKGYEACLKMYDILYDRLTNVHGLHNLIWVWSTPETDWYPGNSKVDIIGYDSYPDNYNYGTQKNMFDRLHTLVKGQKLITMSENGAIPNMNECLTLDSPWLYFMTWNELIWSANTNEHIKEVYNNEFVTTLESTDKAATLSVNSTSLTVAGYEGETTTAITSSLIWKASSNQDWLAVENVGIGNSALNIYFASNTTGSTRTAEITITAEGVTAQKITLTQEVGPTGIEDKEAEQYSVYPNPTSSNLYISGLNRPTSVSVYTSTGALASIQTTEKKLDTDKLPAGLYLIKWMGPQGWVTKRFIKQ